MSYQDPPHEWLSEEDRQKREAAHAKMAEQMKTLFPQKTQETFGEMLQRTTTKLEAMKEKLKEGVPE